MLYFRQSDSHQQPCCLNGNEAQLLASLFRICLAPYVDVKPRQVSFFSAQPRAFPFSSDTIRTVHRVPPEALKFSSGFQIHPNQYTL